MRAFRALYAYNYVQNGWLGDVYHVKMDSITYVKACVSPSQPGIGKADYLPWVAFEDDGHIVTASCTCPAGLGRACSHISAIAYAISLAWMHGYAGQACTDKQPTWGLGSTKSVQPEKLSNISFTRPNKNKNPYIIKDGASPKEQLNEDSTFDSHEDLLTFVKNCSVSALWNCPGTMLHRIMHAPELQTTSNASSNVAQCITHGSHEMDFSEPISEPICEPCKDFF